MKEKITNKVIFVVDDDLPSYQLIEELLSGYGLNIRHFSNGKDLMGSIGNKEIPDLIIMDIQLPGADGLELTKQIKEIDQSIPVIAYTSYAMAGDRDKCLKSGCDEYISKPINLEGFSELVFKYLGE
jgi:two-component system, cell cycle response regulator DivK